MRFRACIAMEAFSAIFDEGLTIYHSVMLKVSVGSGIEDMVSDPVRPINTIHFENPTDRLTDSPTESQSLSK
jgi:hypothetical protein